MLTYYFLNPDAAPKSQQGRAEWLISSGTECLVTGPISHEQQFFSFSLRLEQCASLFHLFWFNPSYSRPFGAACVLL